MNQLSPVGSHQTDPFASQDASTLDIGDCIICPGCGWTGGISELEDGIGDLERGACPRCGYENGMPPYRLLTLSEMREDEAEYYDVRMDLFLEAYIRLLK